MKISVGDLRGLIREAFVEELAPIHLAMKDVYAILPDKGSMHIQSVFKKLVQAGKVPTTSPKQAAVLINWFDKTYGYDDPPRGVGPETMKVVDTYLKAFRSPTSIYSYDSYFGTLTKSEPDTKRIEKFRSDTGGEYDIGMTTSQYRVMSRLYSEKGGELAELLVMSLADLVSPERPERIITVNDALAVVNTNTGERMVDKTSDADMMALHNALLFLSNPSTAPRKVQSALESAGKNVNIRVEPIKGGGLDISALANKIIVRWVGSARELPAVQAPKIELPKRPEPGPTGLSGRFTMSQYAPGPMPSGITARPKGGKVRKGPTGE